MSFRNPQDIRNFSKRFLVDGYLTDDLETAPVPFPCPDKTHRFLQCDRPRGDFRLPKSEREPTRNHHFSGCCVRDQHL